MTETQTVATILLAGAIVAGAAALYVTGIFHVPEEIHDGKTVTNPTPVVTSKFCRVYDQYIDAGNWHAQEFDLVAMKRRRLGAGSGTNTESHEWQPVEPADIPAACKRG